jgi:hypothetical protein
MAIFAKNMPVVIIAHIIDHFAVLQLLKKGKHFVKYMQFYHTYVEQGACWSRGGKKSSFCHDQMSITQTLNAKKLLQY